jgi:hypothetical protein
VRDVIKTLTLKISACKEPLDAQGVGNALYGLQGMNPEHSEVATLLNNLAGLVLDSDPLGAQAITMSLLGLLDMNIEHAAVQGVVTALDAKIYEFIKSSKQQHQLNLSEYRDLWRHINLFEHFNSNHSAMKSVAVLRVFLESVQYANSHTSEQQEQPNRTEREFAAYIRAALEYDAKQRGITAPTMSTSEYIDHFEADIVVRVPATATTTTNVSCGQQQWSRVVNIEIDGTTHLQSQRIRFDRRRDQYLTEKCDIECVCRISLLDKSCRYLTTKERKQTVLLKLQGLNLIGKLA